MGAPSELAELRHRPLVFVDDLDEPELCDADRHHLERALRLRPDEPITLADGAGRWRPARFGDEVLADGPIRATTPPSAVITIAFAPVKGDRSDLVVQKLTELGVHRIAPVTTERSVVRWDRTKADKNLERHRRIVREAAMQSRNLWPPTVDRLSTLDRFLADNPQALLADPAGRRLDSSDRTIVIGPEGGFAPDELADRSIVALPGRILRTETAAMTAAVLAADRTV